jgi:hypothetical protein
LLDRIEGQYNLAGFATDFTTDFEAYLASVDTDEDAAGLQPYTDPDDNPILILADTLWFGPAVTWPKELVNYPYIEFWHRLDNALIAENIPELGQALINDDAWQTLFSSGPLTEDPDIEMSMVTRSTTMNKQGIDQLGNLRYANVPGDIGAVEIQ